MELKKLPYLELTSATTTEEAARLIFRENLLHLHRNLELFIQKDEGRALMQIRIATRRIRVAIELFQEYLRPVSQQMLNDEFKYFGRKMGPTRDLDVLLFGLLGKQCPVVGIEGEYANLRLRVVAEKERQFAKMKAKLQRKRFQTLLLRYAQWLEDPFEPSAAQTVPDLPSFALRCFGNAKAELLKKSAGLDRNNVKELHALRKHVKEYRYNIRFFASLLKPSVVAAAYEMIIPMQDCLGNINDVHVGCEILQRTVADIPPDQVIKYKLANAILFDYFSQDADKSLTVYDTQWARFQNFQINKSDFL